MALLQYPIKKCQTKSKKNIRRNKAIFKGSKQHRTSLPRRPRSSNRHKKTKNEYKHKKKKTPSKTKKKNKKPKLPSKKCHMHLSRYNIQRKFPQKNEKNHLIPKKIR